MCPRWPQRDSIAISIFSFFTCLKRTVEIIAKCCQNWRSNGYTKMWNVTRNRRIHENKMSRKPWRKRYQKGCEKGAQMEVFSMTCQVFQENVYLRFDCAGASGLGFRAFIWCLFAFTFALSFFLRFFMLFGSPWNLRNWGLQAFWHQEAGRREVAKRHKNKASEK